LATSHILNAERGFFTIFSARPFPGAQIVLERVREECSGHLYRWARKGLEGWFSLAPLLSFKQPSEKL
jgi:hypothetical protein